MVYVETDVKIFKKLKMRIHTLLFVTLALLLSSCVPQRLLDESKSKLSACESELAAIKKNTQDNDARLAEMKEILAKYEKKLATLRKDSAVTGANYRQVSDKFNKLNDLNNQLTEKYQKMVAGTEKDNAKLSGELQ